MRPSRSRTLELLGCLSLAALALWPVPALERVLDLALVPARGLVELTAPLRWLGRGEVRAAAPRVEADELRAHRALEEAVLHSAMPREVVLAPGAAALHAEVVDRRDLDTVRVRVAPCRGIEPGLPVVSGDWFVGVVEAVSGERGPGGELELWVQLVTDGEARVGASVRPPGGSAAALVVGGLAPRVDAVLLDVHNPSRRDVRSGEVLVHEPEHLSEGWTHLANGFRLGELTEEEVDGRSVLGVRPGLDYEWGLYQLLVLAPAGTIEPVAGAELDALEDGRWIPVLPLWPGESSAWREGRKIAPGRTRGVREGAALASGVRLIGRVERAGLFSADATLLGDPGFAFPALAVLDREGAGGTSVADTHVVGRLTSLGRDSEGALRFLWPATLPLEDGAVGGAPRRARIWTGSGEVGIPRGLLVGETELPTGPGPHVIRVPKTEDPVPSRIAVRRMTMPREDTL